MAIRRKVLEAPHEAHSKYREFHRKDPRLVGEFHADLVIPPRVRKLGDAIHVMYRSDKVDPETLKQPRKPINYIHEHDSHGVVAYAAEGRPTCDVPRFIVETTALVRLGMCLGISYKDGRGVCDADAVAPLPELYCTPNGRALLVITDRRYIEAIVWGGSLGVEDRGIVG